MVEEFERLPRRSTKEELTQLGTDLGTCSSGSGSGLRFFAVWAPGAALPGVHAGCGRQVHDGLVALARNHGKLRHHRYCSLAEAHKAYSAQAIRDGVPTGTAVGLWYWK